jgi:hypothetical protein
VGALTGAAAASLAAARGCKANKAFPKRALNPYLVFLRKHEPRVRAEHPEMNNTQITRMLAQMWRNVSSQEKVRFAASFSVLWCSAAWSRQARAFCLH